MPAEPLTTDAHFRESIRQRIERLGPLTVGQLAAWFSQEFGTVRRAVDCPGFRVRGETVSLAPLQESASERIDRLLGHGVQPAPVAGRRAPRHAWTEAENEIVRQEYPDADRVELAARLGVTLPQLNGQAARLGARRSGRGRRRSEIARGWRAEEQGEHAGGADFRGAIPGAPPAIETAARNSGGLSGGTEPC